MENKYEMYAEYRFEGRNSAFAAITPFEDLGDELRCIYVSAGARITTYDKDEVNSLIEKSGVDRDANTTFLVKQKEPNEELVTRLAESIQEEGGRISKVELREHVQSIRDELDELFTSNRQYSN